MDWGVYVDLYKRGEIDSLQETSLNNIGTAEEGGRLKIKGRCTLVGKLGDGDFKYPIPFVVLKDLASPLILGRPFYARYVANSCERERALELRTGETIRAHTGGDGGESVLELKESISVPPLSMTMLTVKCPSRVKVGQVGMVYPKSSLRFHLPLCYVTVSDDKTVRVILENKSVEQTLVVEEGMIGSLQTGVDSLVVQEVRIPRQKTPGIEVDDDEMAAYDDDLGVGEGQSEGEEATLPRRQEGLPGVSSVTTSGAPEGVPGGMGKGNSQAGANTAELPPRPVTSGTPRGLNNPHPTEGASRPPSNEDNPLPWGMPEGTWTEKQATLVHRLFARTRTSFMMHDKDVGFVKKYEVAIDTGDALPVVMPQYRLEQTKKEAALKIVHEMMEVGHMEYSSSPWRCPVLLVKKSDGSWRLVNDLRGLNKVTKADNWPLPNIDEQLQRLHGHKWFAKIDISKAFWQVLLHPSSKEKTAFALGDQLFQYRVLPMGLINSPAHLCRIMHGILQPHLDVCCPYMDDVLIMGETFEQLIRNCERVFKALGKAGMKISGSKTYVGVQEVKFLGHMITPEGIYADPEKVEAVKEWPRPRTVTQARQFLGLTNYLRRYIKDYARISQPLTNQTGGEKKAPIVWNEETVSAFEALKTALSSSPVLVHPDFSPQAGSFVVRTDASKVAEGAILYQRQEGLDRVVGYASRVFSKAERNYSNPERESHAIMWAVTHVWRYILSGRKFEVYSDHKPCLAMNGLTRLVNERMQKWAAALATFDYTLFYAKGPSMADCDALSRQAYVMYDKVENTVVGEGDSVDVESIRVFPGHQRKTSIPTLLGTDKQGVSDHIQGLPHVEVNCESVTAPLRVYRMLGRTVQPEHWGGGGTVASIPWGGGAEGPGHLAVAEGEQSSGMDNPHNVVKAQDLDPLLRDVRCKLHNLNGQGERPAVAREGAPTEHLPGSKKWVKKVARIAEYCFLEDNIIYHLSGPTGRRLYVPRTLVKTLLTEMHDAPWGGHLGANRTHQRVSLNYYWPGMRKDIEQWVLSCPQCMKQNEMPHARRRPPMVRDRHLKMFERVAIDVMGPFPKSEMGNQVIVTFTDLATRWVEAIPAAEATAPTVARMFVHNICLRFGPPRSILTDQGTQFLSELMQAICTVLGVAQVHTSAYHPQANAISERAHAVFHRCIAKYVNQDHTDWDRVLPFVVHAYRTTPHAVTGYSPYFLLHGQECTEFVDIMLLPGANEALRHTEWIEMRQELLARVLLARQVAMERTAEAITCREQQAPNTPLREYQPGVWVLIRNFAKLSQGQRARKWLPKFLGPYRILAPLGPTEYRVVSNANDNDVRQYNVDDLKPYHEFALRSPGSSNLLPVNPQGTGLDRNAEEWDVEKVIAHRIIGSRHPTPYYLVRYKGKDSSFDQWVPEALTRCPQAIHNFHTRQNAPLRPPRRKRASPSEGVVRRKRGRKKRKVTNTSPTTPHPEDNPEQQAQFNAREVERHERLRQRNYRRLLRSGRHTHHPLSEQSRYVELPTWDRSGLSGDKDDA
jgi:transposase InsO family protein